MNEKPPIMRRMETMFVGPNSSVQNFSKRLPLTAAQYFKQVQDLMAGVPLQAIEDIVQVLLKAFRDEKTIYVFGNGGSAASASHMVCDLHRLAAQNPGHRRIKAMALGDNGPIITACANDRGYQNVFSEQLRNFVQPGDVAFAISCSGESPNVLLGLRTAREAGALTVALSGFDGSAMLRVCDICAVVPSEHVQMIEDVHHAMLHSISTVLETRMHACYGGALTMAAGHGN
jgi:D-sedoheptulose 7-phosphate isomerase